MRCSSLTRVLRIPDKNMEKIHEQKLFPFHDEAIARRMYDAVKNPVEDGVRSFARSF